jgi:hypothetical protein
MTDRKLTEYKIFTFHTAPNGWRLEVYDINNRLVKVCNAKDRDEAQAMAESYVAKPSERSEQSVGRRRLR